MRKVTGGRQIARVKYRCARSARVRVVGRPTPFPFPVLRRTASCSEVRPQTFAGTFRRHGRFVWRVSVRPDTRSNVRATCSAYVQNDTRPVTHVCGARDRATTSCRFRSDRSATISVVSTALARQP